MRYTIRILTIYKTNLGWQYDCEQQNNAMHCKLFLVVVLVEVDIVNALRYGAEFGLCKTNNSTCTI